MSPEALRSSIGGMVGGICFLVVGVLMVKTGNPGLIHSYHIAHIPSEKIPLVARFIGIGGFHSAAHHNLCRSWRLLANDRSVHISTMVIMDFLLHETSGACPTNNEKIYSFSRTAVLFFSRPTAVRGLLIEH